MNFYNFRHPRQAMNDRTPLAVWRAGIDKIEAAARAVDMPPRLGNANALTTNPQQRHTSKKQLDSRRKVQARSHLKFNDPWSHEWGPVRFVLSDNRHFGGTLLVLPLLV
jgi:hypothetical protein